MMKKDVDYFVEAIEEQRKKFEHFRPSNIAYGSNVMPILQLYKGLSDSEERNHFRDALETLLGDPNGAKRQFAVDICLGFFVFRDAV